MEKKELERLERIEEKLDILFDLIKGKLTTGIYTSGNTGGTTLEHITNPVIKEKEEYGYRRGCIDTCEIYEDCKGDKEETLRFWKEKQLSKLKDNK
jgi:hypothetical protein